ncbi:ATP-binding protein [Streptomyces sp. VRA16 Mangrove soil]|uniref:ATP-binding protein n=1 Tax=Streptomyces sp. VRA16 Mangrove soil TaxID=2817434 RepID=UPI001A9D7AF9|nr:ATP-binding protein [Streptomyces sp. VRA16 Mangrove soil]MBO1334780.1 ATP-binding protein [Streptomyces sp. VRA16 Mangrove soil]
MKQSAAKTLGVAALGAAFAAAGAGAANAAPGVPDAAATLGSVTQNLPTESVTKVLPAGAPESLAAGQNALDSTLSTAKPIVDRAAPSALPTDGGDPVSGLLGGLPVNGLTGGLPGGLGA